MKRIMLFFLVLFLSVTTFGQWKTISESSAYCTETGYFSNSVIKDGNLYVTVTITYYDNWYKVGFELQEYSLHKQSVGKQIGDANYKLLLQLSNDSIYTFTLGTDETALYVSNDWFKHNDESPQFVKMLMREPNKIRCNIIISGEYISVPSKYYFDISARNVTYCMKKIKAIL